VGIITVISNKGGVGKTSIALGAAYYLSARSKCPTLIMELDSSPGDFGPIFDIDSKRSLEMAVRFPANFQAYLKNIGDNLYVLKGFPNPLLFENVGPEEIRELIKAISVKYPNIIIDTQTVFNKLLLDVCTLASKIFLITDHCLESVSRIVNLYEMLTGMCLIEGSKINLIINKKRLQDYFRIWDFSKLSGIPVEGFISFDKNFNKTLFISDKKKLSSTKLYRQLGRIMENDINGQSGK